MGVFLRLLDLPAEEKSAALKEALRWHGATPNGRTYVVSTAAIAHYPSSAFVYDLPEPLAKAFERKVSVAVNYFVAARGLGASNADHVFRLNWEVDAAAVGMARRWMRSNNGSPYAPYYYPSYWVVLSEEGTWRTLLAYDTAALGASDQFGQPGLGYGKRTNYMYAYPHAAEHAFTVEGQALFPSGVDGWTALAIANSQAYAAVVNRFTAQHKYHGYLNQMCFGPLDTTKLGSLSAQIVGNLRQLDQLNELSPCFVSPAPFATFERQILPDGLDERGRVDAANAGRAEVDTAIEEQLDLYVPQSDRTPAQIQYLQVLFEQASVDLWAANLLQWCVGAVFGRWDVRLARDEGLVPALQGPFERLPVVAPGGLVGPDGLPATPERIASEAWLRARPNVITLPEPGSFQGPASIPAAEYPIAVAWDGILVDDEGHPKDIVAKVREVLRYVYGDRAEAIEEEALTLLRGEGARPASLREWFRDQKAAGLGKTFFDFHIQRYSKSRRKAPIYWRLSGGRYSVWLYYHRLTDDTLWRVLNQYVQPKQEMEARRAAELRQRLVGKDGREARQLEAELAETEALVQELEGFAKELRAVAERGYAPDRDDGVIINLAPLHAVVPWREPGAVWQELESGKYDWAKLALRWWPERVRAKCATDKSLAIAHHLEPLYEGE